jgi:hypothetical protein
MAEQIISPGVFTRENDLSFLPAGVGAIGAAIVGPTVKGPAFVPTVVNSFAEYERRFGPLSSETFVPQTVREYLKNAGSVTVCRVLAGGGYALSTTGSAAFIVAGQGGVGNSAIEGGFSPNAYLPGSTGVILSAIYPSKDTVQSLPDLSQTQISTLLAVDSDADGDIDSDDTPQNISGSVMSGSFKIVLSGSVGEATPSSHNIFSASLDPARVDYLPRQLGYSPNNSKTSTVDYAGTQGYTYINFKTLQSQSMGAVGTIPGYPSLGKTAMIQVVPVGAAGMTYGGLNEEKYNYASTPFIRSQQFGVCVGADCSDKTTKELFKFHTLNHGTSTNKDFKISIQNLREPNDIDGEEQYSSFSVLVRRYNDKDKSPVVLEQYNNINLNPDSPNYISRKIGDRYPQYNDTLGKVELKGNYPNISNYVRVEVAPSIEAKSASPKLSPKGFSAVQNPIYSAGLFSAAQFPSASYESSQSLGTDNVYSSKAFLGWRFTDKESDNDNFIKSIPDSAESNKAGEFNVENHDGHSESSLWAGSLSASLDPTGENGPTSGQIKFSIPFQGGQDGIAPWTPIFTGAESSPAGTYSSGDNLYGWDMNETSKAGYKGYKKALDILSNQDEYDINMLSMPGVIKEYHSLVANAGIDMCEERGDAFFVMDLAGKDSSVNNAVSVVAGLDSNYTAVYYPWVKVLDTAQNKPVFVPPSVIVPGAIAASDRIGAEWFAPAGLNRGILGNVLEAKIRLSQAERDVLYDNKINPIATFPQTGVCIWGQKTLQERPTALDRINVRRLLIALKKFIASSSRYLLFEQNTIETRDRFLNIVNPYLESVQQRQGLFAFRVQMDEGNNTPDVIDRNQLVGAVYLQPAKTAEFIVLDFNILPTGATFPS